MRLTHTDVPCEGASLPSCVIISRRDCWNLSTASMSTRMIEHRYWTNGISGKQISDYSLSSRREESTLKKLLGCARTSLIDRWPAHYSEHIYRRIWLYVNLVEHFGSTAASGSAAQTRQCSPCSWFYFIRIHVSLVESLSSRNKILCVSSSLVSFDGRGGTRSVCKAGRFHLLI